MNMHEFQRRLHSIGEEDPTLLLVRKLQHVADEGQSRVLAEGLGGWFPWAEPIEPPAPPIGDGRM
jgi:hypothetical protein